MSAKILLVEDELTIAKPLQFLLQKEGYTVTHVTTGTQAITEFKTTKYDLVLLDIMLPELPGTEVCRQIRTLAATPIVMLSAKDSEIDIVVGLELGADDYITKPYSKSELLARVKAVLRRTRAKNEPETADSEQILSLYDIELDTERHTVTVRGNEINMPLREFELLEILMQHAGRVLTRTQLLDRVWGTNYYGDSKTLDVHVKRIRNRIELNPSQPQILITVRGVGYRFG